MRCRWADETAGGQALADKHGLAAAVDPDTGSFVNLEIGCKPQSLEPIVASLARLQALGVNAGMYACMCTCTCLCLCVCMAVASKRSV